MTIPVLIGMVFVMVFVCIDKINLLHLKCSWDRLEIVAKGFLKLPNLFMLIKQKILSLFGKLPCVNLSELLILFSTRANLLYPLYLLVLRCCLLHLIKHNCLMKTFLRSLILMTHVSLCLLSLLELIWYCILYFNS